MMHSLITVSGYDFLNQFDLSFYDLIDQNDRAVIADTWNKAMATRGFKTPIDVNGLQEIFDLINSEFGDAYGDQKCISLREGLITKAKGQIPIKHNDASRIFSQSKSIYVDFLMSNVLFEYATTFYLWARFPEQKDVAANCFIHTLYLLDGCCRKGKLSEIDGQLSLQKLITENLSDAEIVFIGDLYWCMLSFAMCHELAHIYHSHVPPQTLDEAHTQEFQADASGFDIYMKLIMKHMHNNDDSFKSVFREYLYTAPMILFLFYHDLFTMGYWLYGETISNSHPPLYERIDRLLDLSLNEKYEFDTASGNDVLGNYFDISDLFLKELWYKLKNGKLAEIVRKGSDNMAGKGFEEAYMMDENICKRIAIEAQTLGYEENKLIGLWNIAAQISVDTFGENNGFVFRFADNTYSLKAANIIYNQKVLLESIIEFGLTIAKPASSVETIRTALYILFKIAMVGTIEITDSHAQLLQVCHNAKAYSKAIDEESLLTMVPTASSADISDLHNLGCIEIVEGQIYLRERVIFSC